MQPSDGETLQSWTKLLGHFRMYSSKLLKNFTIKSLLAKLCRFGKVTFPQVNMYVKDLDNSTTTLKGGKEEETALLCHTARCPI